MRKILLAAVTGTALALTACSDGAEEAAAPAEDTMADTATETAVATETVSTVMDANTATAEQLAGVEGVSPELAAAIVGGQPYASVTDLSAKLKETLTDEEAGNVLVNVFVPVNLNTATAEEIKLIPGMTPKMEHEFEEYRPYEDMAEFDREIGKYVDEAEVARFRNYVTL